MCGRVSESKDKKRGASAISTQHQAEPDSTQQQEHSQETQRGHLRAGRMRARDLSGQVARQAAGEVGGVVCAGA